MLRFNRGTGRLWEDHSELLADPNLKKIVGRPKPQPRFRSQQPTTPPAPIEIEDPSTKFRRLVEELVLRGVDYATAVQMIDQEHPDLRQRANELDTARRDVAANQRRTKMAQWRNEVRRRFHARKAGR